MPTDFVSKLRMNNIYPGSGDPSQQQNPFGPPNMNSGVNLDEMERIAGMIHGFKRQEADAQHARELEKMRLTHSLITGDGQSKIGEIGDNIQKPPMNVKFQDSAPKPASEYQRGQLVLGKDKIAQQGELGGDRNDIARQRADTYGAEHNLTNADKQRIAGEQRLSQIGKTGENQIATQRVRGQQQKDNIGLTGAERLKQIELQGDNQQNLQGLRGEQQITNIGATGEQRIKQIGETLRGNKELQLIKGEQGTGLEDQRQGGRKELETQRQTGKEALQAGKPQSQFQIGRGVQNAAQELIATQPDLAQFLEFDPNSKAYKIIGNPSDAQREMIRKKMFGGTSTDIQLPAEKKPADKKKDPAGIR